MAHEAAIGGMAGAAGTMRAARLPVLHRVLSLRLLGCEPGDVISRILVGALFLALALRIGANTLATGRMTGLLLVANEGLVVVLMIVRRPSGDVDRRWLVRAITALSMIGPPLARPLSTPAGGADVATAIVSAVGLAFVVVSKAALGRSFGMVPANRGVVCSGPYRLVRHPIYVGYLVTHVAFLVANPLAWNLLVLGGADVALLRRAVYEEQTLERDESYAAYKQRVRWRILPKVF